MEEDTVEIEEAEGVATEATEAAEVGVATEVTEAAEVGVDIVEVSPNISYF